MKITYCQDYDAMSHRAKNVIVQHLQAQKNSLVCAATGHSPLKTYQLLAEQEAKAPGLFDQLRIIKLDEWGGVPLTDPQTCESFLQENVVKPLKISRERYFTFDSDPPDPAAVCGQVRATLAQQGPIDVCILGLGKNGHLGFNEPAESLQLYCHMTPLSSESLQHSMAQSLQQPPTYGITLGMYDILQARKIILLITGHHKKAILTLLLQQKITTYLPASFLWLHADVECLIDAHIL